MKYTIEGLQQKTLVEYGLNGIDAIILRYVIDFWHTEKMVKVMHKGKEFIWIKYQAIIDALPCIEIKTKIAISRRFKKYVNCGLMEHYHYTKGGSFSCYRFTQKYDPLIQKLKGFDFKDIPPFNSKVKPKDPSINLNSSIKKYIREYFKKVSPEYFQTKRDFQREGSAIKRLAEDISTRFKEETDQISFFDKAAESFKKICDNGIGKNKFLHKTAYIPSKMFSQGIWVEVIKEMNEKKDKPITPDYSSYRGTK